MAKEKANPKIVGPIIAAIGLWTLNAGIEKGMFSARLEKEGVVVSGKVLGREVSSGRKRSTKYRLVTQYLPRDGNELLTQSIQVPKNVYDASPEGAEVQVRYLPSDPASAEIAGAKVGGGFETIFGAIMAVTGVAVALFGFLKKAPPPVSAAPKAAETGTVPAE